MARRPAERSDLDARRKRGGTIISSDAVSSTRVEGLRPVRSRPRLLRRGLSGRRAPTSQVPRRVGTVVDLDEEAALLL
eukprot:CAMPEP_0119276214 /NCGR_PEP_ID=MMETSP1329-20130426/15069_1 /TAXON_ID=114041 /ORGANISM="Genus nov. species nov., Strain RCC1024" /LENGTH=77 /DNA_ID=CAMNT_0007276641 /DNA_START=25 /DNA_END=255 /DNA_ORIENTATION=-